MRSPAILVSLALVASVTVTTAAAQTHPLLNAGPMPSYSEMTETAIWVQTTRDARVAIRYRPIARIEYPADRPSGWVDIRDARWQTSPTVATNAAGDHIALVKITDLPWGHKFEYRLLINGQEVRRDYPLRFQTQPHWRFVKTPAEPPTIKFGLGSCSYINEARTDRPGRPYGGDYEIFGAIAKEQPDAFLWLGDNLYYREMDWLTPAAMRRRWRYDRAFPALQPMLGGMHHYATWDDHDFGPNDSDRSFRLRDEALEIFNEYFPTVRRGSGPTKGAFHRFEWGDVEVFMLDDRYHRSPNRWPAGPDKVMFGREQMEWLKSSLISSNAAVKIIASGNQMINPMALFEAFGQFDTEQKDLFDFIAKNRINGVMFVSGDRHHTELLKVQWPGAAYPWYEFTSSPIGSGGGRNPREENNPARVPGTWVTGTRNFGLIEVTGPRNDRLITLKTMDKDGKLLWKQDIKLSEISAPRP